MLIDFHTHLDMYADPAAALRCINAERIRSVAASLDPSSYLQTKRLGEESPYIIPTFGVHPMRAGTVSDYAALDEFLLGSKIIGEIGLDAVWVTDVPIETQLGVFRYILKHCDIYGKYCVIHTKGAEALVLETLSQYKNARPVIHWYSGPADIFLEMLRRRYHVTFGCETMRSPHIRGLLAMTPPELLLAETDNPDSERWLGGGTDSPLLIRRVVNDIAAALGIAAAEAEHILETNSLNIFSESGAAL